MKNHHPRRDTARRVRPINTTDQTFRNCLQNQLDNLNRVATILAMCMMVGMGTTVFADEGGDEKENFFDIATYSVHQSITVEGEEIPLYVVFDDEQLALSEINQRLLEMLEAVVQEYALEELNSTTFPAYCDAYFSYNERYTGQISEKDSNLWLRFSDIYADFNRNMEILNFVEAYNSGDVDLSLEEYKNTLAIMLPYTSSLSQAFNSNIITPKAFSAANANTYAKKYAEKPISEEYQYYYNSGDCANFASQILEAGGVSQVDYSPDKSKGWWHKVEGKNWLGQWQHSSSESWRLADVFARYQGAYATTKSHYTFSSNIAAGDFIALDHEGNGSWDHIGYVTAKNSYSSTYNGKTYFNYEVAQHTGNYLLWANATGNGWPKAEDNGETYARLRRK